MPNHDTGLLEKYGTARGGPTSQNAGRTTPPLGGLVPHRERGRKPISKHKMPDSPNRPA